MSINFSKLFDMESLARTEVSLHKVTDGVQGVGAISQEALRKIGSRVYNYLPPSATFMDTGIQIDNTGGYANVIESIRTVGRGDFKKTGVGSDTHGEITIGGERSSIQVYGYSASSSYDDIAFEQAKQEGRNISSELYREHGSKYLQKVDAMFYDGIIGAGYSKETAPNEVEDMTNVERSEFFHTMLTQQRTGLNSEYWGDTLICSNAVYSALMTRDYKDFSEMSLGEKIMKDFGIKRIVNTTRFNEKDSTGKDFTFIVNSNSLVNRIPMPLQISPDFKRGWHTTFWGRFRVAGADILELDGGLMLDGL